MSRIKRRGKMIAIAAIAGMLCVSVVGCSSPASSQKPAAGGFGRGGGGSRQMTVEVQEVKLSDVSGGQVFTGAISPAFTTNISSKISGRITAMMVNVGDRVTLGTPLAKIDTTALQQSIAQTQAAAEISQAQLTKAQDDQANGLTSAQLSYDLQKSQYDKTVSDQQNAVVAAKQSLSLAQAQLAKAVSDQQNAIASARESVAIAQLGLNKAVSDGQVNLQSAQSSLNAQQAASDNALQTLQLQLQQALSGYDSANAAYTAAVASNNPQSISTAKDKLDTAVKTLQSLQLQVQQTTSGGANTALVTSLNALVSAQSSQAVQVAQETLNQSLVSLSNAQATASVDVSQQQLAQQQLSLNNAQASQQTTVTVSKAQLAQAGQAVQNAQSTDALDINKAQLEQAQTNLKVLNEQLKDGVLASPVDGIVTAINTPVGQNASAANAVLSIASIDPILATVNVSEANIGKIKLGSAMSVNIPTLNKSFDGAVYAIHPTLDSVTKSYGVDIKVNDPNHELLPGMFAETSLKSEGRQGILVPADAVLNQPSGNAVFTVVDGKAKKVMVKIGAVTSTSFEITSGLKVGDQLVVKGQELLSDNVPVQIVQPGQETSPKQGAQGGQGSQRQGQGQGGQGQGQGGRGQGQGQGGSGQGRQGQSGQGGQRQGGQGGQRQGSQGQSDGSQNAGTANGAGARAGGGQ